LCIILSSNRRHADKWKGKVKMINLDANRLAEVVQAAFDKATGSRRWQMAIARAKVELESNPYIHRDGSALLILSPSNEIYRANGTCQCKAFAHGQPCWHRAAARLVERYEAG
jgi:hypothetical protein